MGRFPFVRQLDRFAEVGDRFPESRAAQQFIAGFGPPFDREIRSAGLGEVIGDRFRFDQRPGVAGIAQRFGGAQMQRLPVSHDQSLIGRRLDQRMLETI